MGPSKARRASTWRSAERCSGSRELAHPARQLRRHGLDGVGLAAHAEREAGGVGKHPEVRVAGGRVEAGPDRAAPEARVLEAPGDPERVALRVDALTLLALEVAVLGAQAVELGEDPVAVRE